MQPPTGKNICKYTTYIYTVPCNLKYFSKFQKLYTFSRLKINLYQKGLQQLVSIQNNTRQKLTCSHMRMLVVVYLDEIFFTTYFFFYKCYLISQKKKKVTVFMYMLMKQVYYFFPHELQIIYIVFN